MLILLPPSEGKTSPAAGPPVSLDSLTAPELKEARIAVLDSLIATSAMPDAAQQLGVPPGKSGEVAANANLRQAATAQASAIYTGVLYDALGLATLSPAGQRLAAGSLLTVSALWGIVGPEDSIPAYRLPMSAALPEIGPLKPWWRTQLRSALDGRAGDDLVVDARSSTYAAVWHPQQREQQVAIHVLTLRGGKERVVSHSAKHTRGLLARHLLSRRGQSPSNPEQLLEAAGEMCAADGPLRDVRLQEPSAKTRSWRLDLVLR